MDLELSSRIYSEGLKPQVKKINNSCRVELLEFLKKNEAIIRWSDGRSPFLAYYGYQKE